MIKILLISGFWPTKQNPISGIFVVQQIKALCAAGCRVTVVVGHTVGKESKINYLSMAELGLQDSAAELIVVPILRLPESLSANALALKLNIFLTAMCVRRVLVPVLPTVDGCIIHGIRYFGLSLSKWRGEYSGNTLIFIHGVDPFVKRDGIMSRVALILHRSERAVTKYVLVGTPLIKHVAEIGIDLAKLVVVPNGTEISIPSVDRLGVSRDDKISIISISNLVPLKGIDDNIRALALLRQRYDMENWIYKVVGDGPERARLEQVALKLGISHKVKFLGRLPYEDTMNELAKADIFSLPSWGEAFGIVYLEAMARFKPAIGCFENGAADIITDGKDGLLVPPKDVEALALALKRLLENRELCVELGKRARLTAEGFTWDVNARRILELLGTEQKKLPNGLLS